MTSMSIVANPTAAAAATAIVTVRGRISHPTVGSDEAVPISKELNHTPYLGAQVTPERQTRDERAGDGLTPNQEITDTQLSTPRVR